MKLPRDVSGPQAVKALRRLGFLREHQEGSHIRLSRGRLRVTVPESSNTSAEDTSKHFAASRNSTSRVRECTSMIRVLVDKEHEWLRQLQAGALALSIASHDSRITIH